MSCWGARDACSSGLHSGLRVLLVLASSVMSEKASSLELQDYRGLEGGLVAELVEEEGDYRYVEDQEQNLPFGGMAMDFVEFDGKKRAGHDDREPLSPTLE
jgi:hypothetical protein